MSNVFISYAKEDAPTAQRLSEALQRVGFSVWWDRHIPPGKTWDDVIGRSLHTADCVLVLWSKISVESRWVREEAEVGAARGCLIPLRAPNLSEATYTFNFVGAQPGCWRVWAVDEQGHEGPKSPWWEFVYTK